MALTVAMGLVARMVLMLPLVAMVLEVVVTVVVVTVLGEKALVWDGHDVPPVVTVLMVASASVNSG